MRACASGWCPLPGRGVGRDPRTGRRVDPSQKLEQREIIGSVGAGDAFCPDFYMAAMNAGRLPRASNWQRLRAGKPVMRQCHRRGENAEELQTEMSD